MLRIVITEISQIKEICFLKMERTILAIKRDTYEFSKIILVHKYSTYEC
jgi:hypothetical protein